MHGRFGSLEPTLAVLLQSILAKGKRALGIVLLAMALYACRHPARDPVTLSYFRLGWSQPDELPSAGSLSQQFTRQTGIRLKNIPVPENTLDQLDLSRKFLQEGNADPDVLGVDVIWSGVLADDLIDLGPYVATEQSSLEPKLVQSYTVQGKQVAIPYHVQIGVLEYRSDLLREYGYDHPPKTWGELERMAERIQAGERARGNRDFWGYVWQGAAAEALTCNALEWQASEGGGRIIESDRTISVNNPAAIRSWQRAKRWIGWISPPGVLGYHEADSINVFDSGRAAFNRVWGGSRITRSKQPTQLHWRSLLPVTKTGYTSMPGGADGSVGMLGGSGLAVSRHSTHPQEAIELVRFLLRAEIHAEENDSANQPAEPKGYGLPSVSEALGDFEKSDGQKRGIVSRPSNETGRTYEEVARAYINAVHSVLTGEKSAQKAALELEGQLTKITGFSIGPPKGTE
jgi:trehalose/maltose transport system substrate-binding protein